ncbi:MAG: hypothetical protein KTR31_04270 [Myxococcales bacterium]|nr:hypothetical protein [Myxococcales bacterium]
MNDDRVDLLVLASLTASDGASHTQARLTAALAPPLRDVATRAEAQARLGDAVARLVKGRQVLDRRGALQPSARGEQRVMDTWGSLPPAGAHRPWLLAGVLGVAHVTAQRLERLDRVEGLRAELIRQRYDLPLEPVSSLVQVQNALGWHLLQRGASNEVATVAGARTNFCADGRSALVALVYTAAGVDVLPAGRTPALLARGLRILAAGAVRTAQWSPHGLKRAIFGRWIRGLRAVVPVGDVSSTLALPDGQFAQQALDAARKSPTGRLGEHLVLISHAHRQLVRSHPAVSLEHFKQRLLLAHRRQELSLKAADMPQIHDRTDLEESMVTYRSSRFCFIRI